MLIPFTKHDGSTLYVRAEDVRRIEDWKRIDPKTDVIHAQGCSLYWLEHDEMRQVVLQGTANEVFGALVNEERRRADEHAERQARASGMLPVSRGRPR